MPMTPPKCPVLPPLDREHLAAVRAHDYQLHVQWYCDNPDCSMRSVQCYIKDLDQTFMEQAKAGIICPLCRFPLKLHYVLGPGPYQDLIDTEARRSVNQQMRMRDRRASWHDFESRVFALSEIVDDRLPATPDGYFSEPAKPDRDVPVPKPFR